MRALTFVLVSTAAAVAAPKPGDEGTPEYETATALVKQLGHPRFATREAAAKELVEMAGGAVPALTVGAKAEDEEVRTRCAGLLPQARAMAWNRRADAYLADPTGKHDLPLLAEWDKLIGKPDAGSRKLYADMVRTSGDFLERAAASKSPTDTAEQCRRILDRVRTATGSVKAPTGELAAVVFADTFNPQLGGRRTIPVPMDYILANPSWEEALSAPDLGPPVRKLLARWADLGGPADSLVFQLFADLVRRKPFPEAVPALIKMAEDKKANALVLRLIAIDALGRIGGKEATATLTTLIGDETDLFDGDPTQNDLLGDAALAALIRMNGRNVADFGITTNRVAGIGAVVGKNIGVTLHEFRGPDDRKKAIDKWKAESAKKDK